MRLLLPPSDQAVLQRGCGADYCQYQQACCCCLALNLETETDADAETDAQAETLLTTSQVETETEDAAPQMLVLLCLEQPYAKGQVAALVMSGV